VEEILTVRKAPPPGFYNIYGDNMDILKHRAPKAIFPRTNYKKELKPVQSSTDFISTDYYS